MAKSMASNSATSLLFFTILSLSSSRFFAATVVEDLNNLHPPPDFNTTISNNCKNNPSLRYCNLSLSPSNLQQIFKFTVVASHLCNVSNNPNCRESFPKIDLRNRPKITPLYLSFDFFWKYCPLTVMTIDLANNSLKGTFPFDVFHCSQLQALDLSLNGFSGEVPVKNLSSFHNLSFLNLSYNHFSESEISDNKFFKRFNSSSFLHSGLVPDHNKYKIKAFVLFIALPLLVIFITILICLPKFTRKEERFTPSTLKESTNGFSKGNLVGTSEGVRIYKGIMRNGNEVRIEVYKGNLSRHEHEKFVVECEILVKLRHKNLVRILGWCSDKKLRAVVAEWTDGENVESWLVRRGPPWKDRVEVLVKILDGMCYLKYEWPEVGYDLKSGSLLLADDREPLISRFRVGDDNNLTKHVYKFGVLLLEMASNKRPREEFEGGESAFVEWMRTHYAQKMWNLIVDEKMNIQTEQHKSLDRAVQLGVICTEDISLGQQPSLDHISQTMITIYNSIIRHRKNHHSH